MALLGFGINQLKFSNQSKVINEMSTICIKLLDNYSRKSDDLKIQIIDVLYSLSNPTLNTFTINKSDASLYYEKLSGDISTRKQHLSEKILHFFLDKN